jgi:HAD superfamily hydrolase (TIGR01509 family)
MIKLIIFDLDGVLVDAKELHYEALNRALASIDPKYVIGKEEHLSRYDGLNTTKKLQMLTSDKGLPVTSHDQVWKLKQEKTIEIIREYEVDHRLVDVLRKLKVDGFSVAVASNSIRETVKFMLLRKGFMDYVDFFLSNQDVKNPKPNAEMYLRCMIKAGVSPKETIIVEDSHIGRKAAVDSGAYLFAVKDSNDVKYEPIKHFSNSLNNKEFKPKWQGGNMNVLIPMGGAGKRFANAGYTFPKPIIPVKNLNDKPMIQVVVENLNVEAHYVYLASKDQCEKYNIKQLLNIITPNCTVVEEVGALKGAAFATLLAKEFINNDQPLLIANSDQFVIWDSNEFLYSMMADEIDAGIVTFTNSHMKWSYARVNPDTGFVDAVKEKEVLPGNHATVGIYYWKRGSDYVKYCEQMIAKGDSTKVNNEWYVCPVFNEAIADGKKIKIFPVKEMHGMGTPEDLEYFQNTYKE